MLDPKFIREHAKDVKKACANKRMDIDVDAWLKLDAERLTLLKNAEAIRGKRNAVAEQMKSASNADRPGLIDQGKKLKDDLTGAEASLSEADAEWMRILMSIPNVLHPDAPVGAGDEENVEVRTVGKVGKLKGPLDHVALAEKHDLIDFPRAAKVSGAKFYYLKGKLALLEQALVRFALDYLVREGFIPMSTPDLAKDNVIVGTGFSPRGPETQMYSVENSDISLIGTSEITLGGYHMDEMLAPASLPLKYAGISHCFRTEAGSYGRESYGLYRVHQFTKVEMFVFCTPEQAEALHIELLRHEENIFKALEIPYRVVDICSGDLGGPAYRKYDLEAWMWGRNEGKGGWGEVTSASNCTDYQARRLSIRTKNADGENVFAYTLNGTAISLARALIVILENHQQADGSIKIPDALVPYCGFDRIG